MRGGGGLAVVDDLGCGRGRTTTSRLARVRFDDGSTSDLSGAVPVMRALPAGVILALVAVLTGCGEGSAPARSSDTASKPAPAVSGGGGGKDIVAVTELGDLPVPGTLEALQRRAAALPDTLDGAGRGAGPPEQIRYVDNSGEFGIDASDVVDIAPGVTTTAQAFDRLRALLRTPVSCAQPPSWCLRGVSEGGPAVIWGHDDSPLLFAATAADAARLRVLLQAWAG